MIINPKKPPNSPIVRDHSSSAKMTGSKLFWINASLIAWHNGKPNKIDNAEHNNKHNHMHSNKPNNVHNHMHDNVLKLYV